MAALSLCGYLLASARTFRPGFPLDDAWIYQTYARNLARYGEWAFVPGQPSGGSTGPLWVLFVLPGQWLGALQWTFFLGWLTLAGLGVAGAWAFARLSPQRRAWAVWAGAFLALEWHLVWAAASGMEAALYTLLVMAVLGALAGDVKRRAWFVLGLLAGVSVWLRPDGLTLLGPLGFAALLREGGGRERSSRLGLSALGLALLFAPYLAFNRHVAGAWWPNTFYAKQAEYAVLRQAPLWRRFLQQAALPLVGVGMALLPAWVLTLRRALSERRWGALAGALWTVGYLGLYAWRLPVTYQHGRYVIPAMAVYFVWGLAGMAETLQLRAQNTARRLVSRAWALLTAGLLLAFWGLGARAYAQDVAVIESEMVDTARWVAENIPEDALVAAHDIGALGYFSGRMLVDLAGLVTPDVIPILRDEAALKIYLDRKGVKYLVTFPGWYPHLTQGRPKVYQGRAPFSPALGGEHMTVFLWSAP
ncbi:MAG: hypothetical protein D6803_06320 [Anaerolineae bacterium]|nr:MAG: hypothetical protein D6803_06320 [Anaerolineae bacterium]